MAMRSSATTARACRHLEDRVGDFLDGSLRRSKHLELETHVNGCSECRSFLAAYQRTIRVAKMALWCSSDAAEAPEALIQAILRSLYR
jgi:hypothetical protein